MRVAAGIVSLSIAAALLVATLCLAPDTAAQENHLLNPPTSAAAMSNPYQGSKQAAAAGKKLYGQNCAQCHGLTREGMNNAPSLKSKEVRAAKPGALFWFITNGDLQKGMPAWSNLPKPQRWEIVTFLQGKTQSRD